MVGRRPRQRRVLRHLAVYEEPKPMRPRNISAPPQRSEARMIAAHQRRREHDAAPPRVADRRAHDRARVAAEVDEAVREDALEHRIARDGVAARVAPLRIFPNGIFIESPVCPRIAPDRVHPPPPPPRAAPQTWAATRPARAAPPRPPPAAWPAARPRESERRRRAARRAARSPWPPSPAPRRRRARASTDRPWRRTPAWPRVPA